MHPRCIKLIIFINNFSDNQPIDGNDLPEGNEVSMDHYILRRLDTVSRIRAQLGCKCRFPTGRMIQCYIFNIIRDGIYECVPAIRNYDIHSLEFDEDYANYIMEEYHVPAEIGNPLEGENNFGHLARDVRSARCTTCKGNFNVQSLIVPDCTWLLVVEFPRALYRVNMDRLSCLEVRVGGDVFYLAWVQLQNIHNKHYISLHYFQQKWFYYDDLDGNLIRYEPREVNYNHFINRRAFYYRKTPVNPHRCLEKLHTVDLENSMIQA